MVLFGYLGSFGSQTSAVSHRTLLKKSVAVVVLRLRLTCSVTPRLQVFGCLCVQRQKLRCQRRHFGCLSFRRQRAVFGERPQLSPNAAAALLASAPHSISPTAFLGEFAIWGVGRFTTSGMGLRCQAVEPAFSLRLSACMGNTNTNCTADSSIETLLLIYTISILRT